MLSSYRCNWLWITWPLAKCNHNGKCEAAWKLFSTTVSESSITETGGNISGSVRQIDNTAQEPEGTSKNPSLIDLSSIICNIDSSKEPEGLNPGPAWVICGFDVVSELTTFWEASSHLARTQGNISDIRIL
ncbi:unnamed protein product [Absidia cylindrospora]